MLDLVKTALRIKADAFDDEIQTLIDAAVADLGLVGMEKTILQSPDDYPLVKVAIITYCKIHFGDNEKSEQLQRSYDMQKSQMMYSSDYRWNEDTDG